MCLCCVLVLHLFHTTKVSVIIIVTLTNYYCFVECNKAGFYICIVITVTNMCRFVLGCNVSAEAMFSCGYFLYQVFNLHFAFARYKQLSVLIERFQHYTLLSCM